MRVRKLNIAFVLTIHIRLLKIQLERKLELPVRAVEGVSGPRAGDPGHSRVADVGVRVAELRRIGQRKGEPCCVLCGTIMSMRFQSANIGVNNRRANSSAVIRPAVQTNKAGFPPRRGKPALISNRQRIRIPARSSLQVEDRSVKLVRTAPGDSDNLYPARAALLRLTGVREHLHFGNRF